MLDTPVGGPFSARGKIFTAVPEAAGTKHDQVIAALAAPVLSAAMMAPITASYVLEIMVTVQSAGTMTPGPSDEGSGGEDAQNAATSTILGGTNFSISGFSSPEAAVEAANAMAEWCQRWSHSCGLRQQPPANNVDKAVNTDESMTASWVQCCPSCREYWGDRDSVVGEMSPQSAEAAHGHMPAPSYASSEHGGYRVSSYASAEHGGGAPLHSDSRSTHQRPSEHSNCANVCPTLSLGSGAAAGSIATSGGAWSSESGSRLSLHRDSLELQSNASHRSKGSRLSKGKQHFYQEAKSKIIGLLGRGSEDTTSNGDASDDEVDLSTWSRLSETRETALLKGQPKHISKRNSRPLFRNIIPGLAGEAHPEKSRFSLPKTIAGIGHSQNRSYTPPQYRTNDPANDPRMPESSRGSRSASKDARGRRSPRCKSPNTPSANGNTGRTYLLGVLDTAPNCNDTQFSPRSSLLESAMSPQWSGQYSGDTSNSTHH